MKKLPIGIQSFENIINEGFIYIDKTSKIHTLVTQGKYYFLARPRRFGKSLLISTLTAFFMAKRNLFKGLWIDQMENWEQHPVIHIDFSALSHCTSDDLYYSLQRYLQKIATDYGQETLDTGSIQESIIDLIKKLAQVNKVVILIDEYDHPIVSHLHEIEIAKSNRTILRNFFTAIKSQDAHLRFLFLTGISKFTQVSLFSGLNNLNDITLNDYYADLLGYTEEEIRNNFSDHLKSIVLKLQNDQKDEEQLIMEMRSWYNGYRFSPESNSVYNPFSVLKYLDEGRLRSYWFDTGTPSFLIQLIEQRDFPIQFLDHAIVGEASFSNYDIESLQPFPLLFQTGYLTIRNYFKDENSYLLDFPNCEVKMAFFNHLASSFTKVPEALTESYLLQLRHALYHEDLTNFFECLRLFFANIPYSIQISQEKYYQTIIFVIAQLLGLNSQAEITTHIGRIDLCIELPKLIYLFEFKFGGSSNDALQQIKAKKYGEKYCNKGKKIIIVGAAFSPEERNMGDWIAEEFS